jgi:hypothetical protein
MGQTMKHLYRSAAVVGALALFVTAGCGSDDDSSSKDTTKATTTIAASSDGTGSDDTGSDGTGSDDGAAPMAGTEFCDLALELAAQEDVPSVDQMKEYQELAPEEVSDAVDTAVSKLLESDGDMVKFFAIYAEDDVEAAVDEMNAFEDEQCGTDHAGDEAPTPEGASTEVEDDATRVDVTAKEYTFEMPEELDAGRTSFVLTNQGDEAHFLLIVKLKEGVTLDEAMQSEDDSMMEGTWETGIAAPDGQDEEVITFDLEPGNYGALCFLPGPTGQPHAMSGMAVSFTVS